MNSALLQVDYGEQKIKFGLQRRPRKTLSISVNPDQSVEVVAPLDVSVEHICEKVRKRAPWIIKQLAYFGQFQPRTPDRQFISGETHLYLGRQYKLKVRLHAQQNVKLIGGELLVHSHRPSQPEWTRTLVDEWYGKRAHQKFMERIAVCQQRFPDPEAYRPSGLVVRHLSQRWGSMTSSKRLILNRSLIRASTDLIDYVIIHELCHLAHAHHGPAFYSLLGKVMPDWEQRKAKLERQLA